MPFRKSSDPNQSSPQSGLPLTSFLGSTKPVSRSRSRSRTPTRTPATTTEDWPPLLDVDAAQSEARSVLSTRPKTGKSGASGEAPNVSSARQRRAKKAVDRLHPSGSDDALSDQSDASSTSKRTESAAVSVAVPVVSSASPVSASPPSVDVTCHSGHRRVHLKWGAGMVTLLCVAGGAIVGLAKN